VAEVTFCGERFELTERPSKMALMEFASVAVTGADSESLEGLAALHNLLQECIGEAEWPRFKALAREHKSDDVALFGVVNSVFEAYSEIPTTRPSDSSDGPENTSPRSEGDVFSRSKAALEAKGRPDLAVVVMQAQEAQAV
jgi:hypothetical protein